MYSASSMLSGLQSRADRVVRDHVAPLAEQVDRDCMWPAHSMRALGEEGLLGLQAPEAQGGLGQGLLALVTLTEILARACPSTAMSFGMHCVGTAVIAAKATPYQQEHYLRPIARGEHVTTLALAESGSGAHFYLPETELAVDEAGFLLEGTKQFITNGGHADSYVMSAAAAGNQAEPGNFSCLIVDKDSPGIEWLAPWQGFGMRGNSSRGARLSRVRVPRDNLVGEEGDQVWYVFEVVTPYFLMAMAGTYLGIAQSALDAASEHLQARRHTHSEERLADVGALQTRYAEMWIAVEKTRSLVHEAATRADRGDPDALPFILVSKADAGETAVRVANDAMTLCGGQAYRENSRVAQMLRDARASHVMAPTTDIVMGWTGRALLGLPLL